MKILNIALIGSALVLPSIVAVKETHDGLRANAIQFYGRYKTPWQAMAPPAGDRADFSQPGTRGREDPSTDTFQP